MNCQSCGNRPNLHNRLCVMHGAELVNAFMQTVDEQLNEGNKEW